MFFNPLPLREKLWVIQSCLTFDSMNTEHISVTIHRTAVTGAVQFYPVCNFDKFINLDFALSRVKGLKETRKLLSLSN